MNPYYRPSELNQIFWLPPELWRVIVPIDGHDQIKGQFLNNFFDRF